jgi:hypothetical protein
MKRWKLSIIILVMLLLTGCIQKYDLNEQQNDAVAEYLAGVILKSDEDYKQNLVSEEGIGIETSSEDNSQSKEENSAVPSPTAAPAEVADQSGETDETAESKKEYTIAQVFGKKDFDIQYSGYELTDTYPKDAEDTYFSLDARKGYQLLVASFTATNKKKSKNTLNLSKEEVLYQLDINVGTVYKPQFTLLENDLQYIDLAFKGGESKTVLLVFEISKEADISNINLIISKDDRSEIIEIK